MAYCHWMKWCNKWILIGCRFNFRHLVYDNNVGSACVLSMYVYIFLSTFQIVYSLCFVHYLSVIVCLMFDIL